MTPQLHSSVRSFIQSFTVLLLFLGSVELALADKKGTYSGAMETEYPSWFKDSFLNLREDIQEAAKKNRRVMLLFHQDRCPYCNALVERNLSQKNIETAMRKHFDVIAVNLWGDREVVGVDGKSYTEKTLGAALKVQFTPTILFFDEKGNTVLRLNGYIPPARFKTALDYVAQKKESSMPFRDFVAQNEKPSSKAGALNPELFFASAPYDLRKQATGGKPVAVFFEQKDCPDCDVLHGQVLPDEETRKMIGKFHTIQVDMWSDTPVITPQGEKMTAREWAKRLDVKYAPTIVVFNEQGKEIIRSEAFFKVFHTHGLFAYVHSGAYRKEPSFQRYLSARAEKMMEEGKNVDIWRLADEPQKPRKGAP